MSASAHTDKLARSAGLLTAHVKAARSQEMMVVSLHSVGTRGLRCGSPSAWTPREKQSNGSAARRERAVLRCGSSSLGTLQRKISRRLRCSTGTRCLRRRSSSAGDSSSNWNTHAVNAAGCAAHACHLCVCVSPPSKMARTPLQGGSAWRDSHGSRACHLGACATPPS